MLFFKVERDEDILRWSGRELHNSVAGGMKRREFWCWRDNSDERMGYELMLGR